MAAFMGTGDVDWVWLDDRKQAGFPKFRHLIRARPTEGRDPGLAFYAVVESRSARSPYSVEVSENHIASFYAYDLLERSDVRWAVPMIEVVARDQVTKEGAQTLVYTLFWNLVLMDPEARSWVERYFPIPDWLRTPLESVAKEEKA